MIPSVNTDSRGGLSTPGISGDILSVMDKISTLIPLVAWHQTGTKSVPEPMMQYPDRNNTALGINEIRLQQE